MWGIGRQSAIKLERHPWAPACLAAERVDARKGGDERPSKHEVPCGQHSCRAETESNLSGPGLATQRQHRDRTGDSQRENTINTAAAAHQRHTH